MEQQGHLLGQGHVPLGVGPHDGGALANQVAHRPQTEGHGIQTLAPQSWTSPSGEPQCPLGWRNDGPQQCAQDHGGVALGLVQGG